MNPSAHLIGENDRIDTLIDLLTNKTIPKLDLEDPMVHLVLLSMRQIITLLYKDATRRAHIGFQTEHNDDRSMEYLMYLDTIDKLLSNKEVTNA